MRSRGGAPKGAVRGSKKGLAVITGRGGGGIRHPSKGLRPGNSTNLARQRIEMERNLALVTPACAPLEPRPRCARKPARYRIGGTYEKVRNRRAGTSDRGFGRDVRPRSAGRQTGPAA